MLGTIVNTCAVIAGSLIGICFKKGVPRHVSDAVMTGVGLCVVYLGIDGCLKGQNPLITVISIAVGAIMGTLFNLDARLNNFGNCVEKRFNKNQCEKASFAQGLVSSSLLFCVGAMAIVGALQSGLNGDNQTLYTKSLLDFISSIIFASSMGIGVLFSSIILFVYQGTITLLSELIAPFLSDAVIAEMTCTGSILLIGLGLNLLGITKIKIMNYIPAIFIPIILCLFM